MSDLDTKIKNQNLMTYGPLVKDYEQKIGMIISAIDSLNLSIQLLDYVRSDFLPDDPQFTSTKENLNAATTYLFQVIQPELRKALSNIQEIKKPYAEILNQYKD